KNRKNRAPFLIRERGFLFTCRGTFLYAFQWASVIISDGKYIAGPDDRRRDAVIFNGGGDFT
ncbi:hypothetical protein, partial [Aminivibrio sp.]|uniref:hypothetical protein n=1 Tax=Aminivibrio sp. TaxID=1872489 RepID=UPI00345ED546